MEIRRVDTTRIPDALAARQVGAVAFRSSAWYRQLLDEISEIEKSGGQLPDPANDDPARTVWGAYLEDKLIAVVQAIDYQMRYEGQTLPMCGIGGVATLPEYRRQGSIRKLMKEILEDCRLKGQIFSYLYPFSYFFYGKFGYGHGCRRMAIEIPMSSLKLLPETGRVRRCGPGDELILQTIYEHFTANTNGAVVRSAGSWKRKLEKDPVAEQIFTYLWSDAAGKPSSWMTYGTKKVEGGDHFQIYDWACLNHQALAGLLAFIKRFDDQYTLASLKMPLHVPVDRLFPEPYPIKHQLEFGGQIRVIDISRALELMRRPFWMTGDFQSMVLNLMVDDDFLVENSGHYAVDFSGPVNRVTFTAAPALNLAKAQSSVDLSVTARSLATLLLGCSSLKELDQLPEVKVNPDLSDHRLNWLRGLVSGKENAIYDYF